MPDNGIAHITRNEFDQGMGEMVENIVELQEGFNAIKLAINTQAEVLGLLKHIIQTYIPVDRVEAAAKEYREVRQREIALATSPTGNA